MKPQAQPLSRTSTRRRILAGSIATLLSATSLLFCTSPARAASFNIGAGVTENNPQTLNNTETGNVAATGTLSVGGGTAAITLNAGTTTVTNSGTIEHTLGDAAIVNEGGGNDGTISITNNAGAIIRTASADTILVSRAASNITLNNSGQIISTNALNQNGNRAIDLNSITTGTISITNTATGIIRANASDAIRTGTNATVINLAGGMIEALPFQEMGSASGSDGIQAERTGVTIENTGTINGRHGIAGNGNNLTTYTITVINHTGGNITGVNGSGVNIDGLFAGATASVTNEAGATITGTTDGVSANGDGDAVDVDGVLTLINSGIVRGLGAAGVDSGGLDNNSEGVAAGGGTITNNAGGMIFAEAQTGNLAREARGILIDDGSNGSAVAATTVTNAGTIRGFSGFAIKFVGNFADTITNQAGGLIRGAGTGAAIQMGDGADQLSNAGTITGDNTLAVDLGGGDDMMTVTGNTAVITGKIDGGTGLNTLDFTLGAGNAFSYAGEITNFNAVNINSGTVTLSGANTYTGATTINGGALQLTGSIAAGSTVNVLGGALSGTGTVNGNATLATGGIINFQAGGNIVGTLGVTGGTWNDVGTVGGNVNVTSGNLAISAGANLTTNSTVNVSGTATITAADATSTITGNVNITTTASISFGGTIAGAASTVTVNNSSLGTQFELTAANTYGGLTTVTSGYLQLGLTGTLGTTAAGTVVSNTGTLALAGVAVGAEALTINGMGSTNFPSLGALYAFNGANTYAGAITVASNASIVVEAGSSLTLTGGITKSGTTLTLSGRNGGGGVLNINTVGIGGAAANSDLIVDSLTVNENVANTYNGPTFIRSTLAAGSGIVNATVADALPTANGRSAVTMDDAGLGGSQLNLGAAQSVASLAGAASSLINLNANTLTIGTAAGTTTFAGVISGGGGITKDGASTQILTGLNTYLGTTAINGGVLAINAENNLGPGPLTFNGGTLSFLQPIANFTRAMTLGAAGGTFDTPAGSNSTISGVISGAGGLTKTGAGTLTLPGANTYLGTTNVNGGTLFVDGSLASPIVNVNPGGLLGGNGTFAGVVNNLGGIVSPGKSVGTLNIGGNFTQSSAGTLDIEVESANSFDRLVVGGSASLNGTLRVIRLGNYQPQVGDRLVFLTAGGGVSGTFATVNNAFPALGTLVRLDVIYGSNNVALVGVQNSFAAALGISPASSSSSTPSGEVISPGDTHTAPNNTFFEPGETIDGRKAKSVFGITPNQIAVALALDSALTDRRLSKVLNYLNHQDFSDILNDLDRIAPEELTSMYMIGTQLAQVQSVNLQRRTDDLRSGASGFSASGLAMQGTGPGFNGPVQFRTGFAGPTGDAKESKEIKQVAPPEEQRWGAFLTGVGEWVDVDGDGNARGYDITTGGFTLGLDYKVCSNFAVGVLAGYAGTGSDLTDGGSILVNGGKLGLYATAFAGGWYADVAAIGGYNSYDTKRSALQGTARGSTEGGELNVLVGTGYDFKVGALTIGPTATFNYTLVGVDDFTEHGSLAPLRIGSRNQESVRSAFGIKASYDWRVGGVIIKPEIRAAWQHDYGDSSYDLDASFANGAGANFLVNGPKVGRDSALLGAGFAVQCSERCSTYVYYDGELGRERLERHAVSGGVRIAF